MHMFIFYKDSVAFPEESIIVHISIPVIFNRAILLNKETCLWPFGHLFCPTRLVPILLTSAKK